MAKRKTKTHETDTINNTSEMAKLRKKGINKHTENTLAKPRIKQKTTEKEEKKITVPQVKNQRKKKNAEIDAPAEVATMVIDNDVSEYFPASADSTADRARSGKRNLKAGNSSSYSSKIKQLKNSLTSEDATASESESEKETVTYRSPEDKKKHIPETKKHTRRSRAVKIKTSDGINVSTKESSKVNAIDEHDEDKQKRVITMITNRDKPCTVTHNRKRKSTDMEAGSENKEIVKKPKKKREPRKQTRCRKEGNEKGKGDSLTKSVGQRARLFSEMNNNNSLKTAGENDNLAILKQAEGRGLEKTTPDESLLNGSSDEEMMDVEENTASVTLATPLPKSVDQSDAMAILMHMEGPKPDCSTDPPSTSTANNNHGNSVETLSDVDEEDDGDSDDVAEWEDVEDHHGSCPKKSQLPSEPVEITLEAPVIYKKRKKGGFDLETYFRRQINKFKREVAMDIHKVHLLCLLSRCQYLNRLCEDETIQAQALSITLVTKELKIPSVKSCTENHVTQVLSWINAKKLYLAEVMEDSLHDVSTQLRTTLICVILLRQVGFLTRLMTSLQPVPFKQTNSKSSATNKGKSSQSAKNTKVETSRISENKFATLKKRGKVNKTTAKLKSETIKSESKTEIIDSKDDGDREGYSNKGRRLLLKRRSSDRKCSKVTKNTYKVEVDCDAEALSDETDKDFIPEDDESGKKGTSRNGREYVKKHTQCKKSRMKEPNDSVKEENMSSDEDFEDESIQTQNLKKETTGDRNRNVLSSRVDQWVEVYLHKEQKWICVDSVSVQVKKPHEIENQATQPIRYVVGITQNGYMRDVTPRYACHWLTETRKVRVDGDWWDETLDPYRCHDKRRDEIEDRELNSRLQQRPLPTSIGAFKSHPLYALSRHLLKFEAIYPDTSIPVGYIRGEPVYARECVHTLHSRENWLKEGRAVRIGEEPYKFVKSRPKWNRPKEDPEAKDLELFGRWQTEVYIPPPAVDGIVPRNAHGNVEMFLPSMLPAGTVHLKLPALNKVAKKLDIDCAPAMIGWDNHCGFSHPLMDGWIVCKEHKDVLLAAWDEEQEINREKEQQKREKRVYDSWRKLIRGVLIKERLKKRFQLEERPNEGPSVNETSEMVECSPADDLQHAWPQNRLSGRKKPHSLSSVKRPSLPPRVFPND